LSNKGLLIFPTFAKIYESVAAMSALNDVTRGILMKLKDLLTSTDETIDIAVGQTTSISTVPYGYLAVQVEALLTKLNSLVGSYQAMGVAEFNALREQRIRDGEGSGSAEWGKDIKGSSDGIINEGMWARIRSGFENKIGLGASGWVNQSGLSRTEDPLMFVNGVRHNVSRTASTGANTLVFPPAPDGTKTYDSATGLVVTHSSSTIAFASETETNKVITSRQDYIFLESFHEKISDKGVVYPLGNVQYGASTWKGINLSNTLVAQGYSAFGEWDADTKGYGAIWDDLEPEEQAIFLQDLDNNIYSDNGELIHVRYRIRVIEGLGDEWASITPESGGNMAYIGGAGTVKVRGSSTTYNDLGSNANGVNFYSINQDDNTTGVVGTWALHQNVIGLSHGRGMVFAIPIALVQRRNQGAYHPSFNPDGCSNLNSDDANSKGRAWWGSATLPLNSTAQAFNIIDNAVTDNTTSGATRNSGEIGDETERSDDKFHDAIYASDVQDLRMSSRRVPVAEIREKYKRMAIAGEVRGFEGVPFTKVIDLGGTLFTYQFAAGYSRLVDNTRSILELNEYDIQFSETNDDLSLTNECGYLVGKDSGYIVGLVGMRPNQNSSGLDILYIDYKQGDISTDFALETVGWYLVVGAYTNNEPVRNPLDALANMKSAYKQANPTWTDIIGDPANIVTTFPNGIEGQWIPEIPFSSTLPLNRKLAGTTLEQVYTADNGDTWTKGTVTIDSESNARAGISNQSVVCLNHYETQAHFTRDDVNITQLTDWSPVYATNDHKDAILTSSLIGKIATGSDPSEELSITKIVSDVVSHTPETLTPVVKYSTAIGVKEGVAYLLFNCDDSGVIDGSNIKSTALPYFINEA
jgi:hypothetical protein